MAEEQPTDVLADAIAKLNKDTLAGANAIAENAKSFAATLDQFRSGRFGTSAPPDPYAGLTQEQRQVMQNITTRLVRAPMLIPYVSMFLDEKFTALAKATQDVLGPLPPPTPPPGT